MTGAAGAAGAHDTSWFFYFVAVVASKVKKDSMKLKFYQVQGHVLDCEFRQESARYDPRFLDVTWKHIFAQVEFKNPRNFAVQITTHVTLSRRKQRLPP